MKKFFNFISDILDDLFLCICTTFSFFSLTFIILKKTGLSSLSFKCCFVTLFVWFFCKLFQIVHKGDFKSIKKPLIIFLVPSVGALVLLFINYLRFRFALTSNSLSFIFLFLSVNIVLFLTIHGNFTKKTILYSIILSLVISVISFICFVSGFARTWNGLKSGAGLTLNFSNPNLTGIFLITISFLNVFGIFVFRNYILKIVSLLSSLCCIALLVLTSARTPFIALFVSFVFVLLVYFVKKIKKDYFISGVSLIASCLPIILSSVYIIVSVLATPDGIISDGGVGKSAFSRYDIWIEGFSFIGNSATNFLFGDYAHSMGNGHNSLITVWQQYGLFVLLFEIIFVFFMFRETIKKSSYHRRSQWVGCLFMFTIWFIGLFEATPIISSNGMFVFFGLSVVLNKYPIGNCKLLEQENIQSSKSFERVLLISNVYAYGSIGNIVQQIHLNNIKKNINSYVIYGRNNQNLHDPNTVCIENLVEVYLTKKVRRILKNQYIGNFFMTREIINTIKSIKPTVVHIHALNDDYVNYKSLLKFLSKCKGTKTIYTHHSEYMYNGLCGAHANDCNQFISNHCANCSLYKGKSAKRMFDIKKKLFDNFKNSDFVTTSVSPWLHSRIKLSEIFKNHDDVVVLNGSNIHYFVDETKEKSNYILYVTPSIDNSQKKFDDLLEIARLNNDLNFLVLTLRKSQHFKDMDNIKIISGTSDIKSLARYYSMARVTILTGTRETFSMPVIESLLCGTPVVGYECGGPESLQIEQYASFVENGNVNLLNIELHKFLKKAYNSKMIQSYALKRFSSETMCKEYQKLYLSNNYSEIMI